MGSNTHWRDTAFIAGPVTLAGGIYILFRHESLLLFDGLQHLHLLPLVSQLRTVTVPLGATLPNWVLFSLPDGLWLLSYLLFIRRIWAGSSVGALQFWTGAGFVLSIGHELSQAAGWAMGTFDWMDLVAYSVAALVGMTIGQASQNIEKP